MKISHISHQHNSKTPTYQGGMSSKIMSEIKLTDCNKVQNRLTEKYGIKSDFAENKIIAWSVNRVVQLLNELQKKYNLNFSFPSFIITGGKEDFNLHMDDSACGFTNFLPCKFNKKNDDIVPGMSIIFNKNYSWEKLDENSDLDFERHYSATNYFLEPFFHEFCHIIHESNLIKRFSGQALVNKLNELLNPEFINKYQTSYAKIINENICNYASESPLETIACDMSKRFIDNLDLRELEFKQNPFKASPYEGFSIRKIFKQKTPLDIMLKAIYNGETDILTK